MWSILIGDWSRGSSGISGGPSPEPIPGIWRLGWTSILPEGVAAWGLLAKAHHHGPGAAIPHPCGLVAEEKASGPVSHPQLGHSSQLSGSARPAPSPGFSRQNLNLPRAQPRCLRLCLPLPMGGLAGCVSRLISEEGDGKERKGVRVLCIFTEC